MIDIVILNNLANQNKAPYELIKKGAKNKEILNANSNAQLTTEHSKHSALGQSQTSNKNQFQSQLARKQSDLSQLKSKNNQPICKNLLHTISTIPEKPKMSRRTDTEGFDGGFIPSELTTN